MVAAHAHPPAFFFASTADGSPTPLQYMNDREILRQKLRQKIQQKRDNTPPKLSQALQTASPEMMDQALRLAQSLHPTSQRKMKRKMERLKKKE